MANVYGADSAQGGAPAGFSHAYGNAWTKAYTSAKVAQIGDVLYLGRIPAGTRVNDFDLVVAGGPASATCKIGYTPVSPNTTPAASDAYWFPLATGLTTNARTNSKADPITFTQDVDIIATIAGAATNTSNITVVLRGEILGVR
jgi:hypothetical protein